jgi:hypothetical protein
MSILLLSELRTQRAQKAEELEFYTAQKAKLETKLDFLRREIRLTDTILEMLRHARMIELGHKHDPHL